MQTARAALGVALRVCPRTAVSTYTRPAAGMVLVHTSTPHPSGSQQNCLRPEMPYKTGHADWSGLDLGLFIGAGVVVTAGLYERKLRCAVLYTDWREDSQFCQRDDVTTNQKVRFSWFGQEDDDDIDDVTEVKVYCAVLESVWREECWLVENHMTSTTGGDDDMESYYPGHGCRNDIQFGNENWV